MRRALFLLYLKFVYVPVNGPLKTGSETCSRWEASGYFVTLERAVHHLTDLQLRDSKRPQAEVRELHTFDATPILRMTAFAYNQPVRR